MFTLSFYEHNSTNKTVIQATRYSIADMDGISSVSVCRGDSVVPSDYFDIRSEPDADSQSFRECYVTNDAGRTIDHVVAKIMGEGRRYSVIGGTQAVEQ